MNGIIGGIIECIVVGPVVATAQLVVGVGTATGRAFVNTEVSKEGVENQRHSVLLRNTAVYSTDNKILPGTVDNGNRRSILAARHLNFSHSRDFGQARFEETAKTISTITQKLEISISENAQAMQELRRAVAKANKSFSDCIEKLMNRVNQSSELTQQDANLLLFYQDTHSSLLSGYERSMQLQLELSKSEYETYTKQYKDTIDSINYTQIVRIQTLAKQWEFVNKQNQHEFELFKEQEKMAIEKDNAVLERLIQKHSSYIVLKK